MPGLLLQLRLTYSFTSMVEIDNPAQLDESYLILSPELGASFRHSEETHHEVKFVIAGLVPYKRVTFG